MEEPPKNKISLCPCRCSDLLTQRTIQRHLRAKAEAEAQTEAQAQAQAEAEAQAEDLAQARARAEAEALLVQYEALPPPKRRRITHFQADASSSSGRHPQSCTPEFKLDPPLPSLDRPADLDQFQSLGDVRTVPSHHLVNDVLLDLHARTHRNTDESDDKGSEDALEEDAVEAADSIDPGTDNREDIGMEGKVDSCEGVVSDWDILAEDFIAKAEELGKFEPFLIAYSVTH